MFQHFICGAFDPRGQDGRTKSRKNSFRKSKGLKRDDKNPYSDRGLDKFSALLAELEDKKQKIYSQADSQQGMPLVLFTYKNSTDIVPIVIRLKDDKEAEKKKSADTNTNTNASKDHHPVMKVVDSESEVKKQVIKKISSGLQSFTNRNQKKRFSWNLERPSYYVPAILVLILLLLVFFGRSVSILFTCIAWYLVPVMQGMSYNKKKGYVRKLSHNRIRAVGDKSSPIREI